MPSRLEDGSTQPLLGHSTPDTDRRKTSWLNRTLRSKFWRFGAIIAAILAALALLFAMRRASSPDKWPASPTSDPFPTRIGFPGYTATGSEALAAATAFPRNNDLYPLRSPDDSHGKARQSILYNFGNLSPMRSVDHGLGTGPDTPSNCKLVQAHVLHRHGARYPTLGAGPAEVAARLANATFKATGPLSFLNDWTYKLGAEILTPFGRKQLFNLGVGIRIKYGHLLDHAPKHKLVFRTESQDRMLYSALNFAAGFWGIPYEDQYHQVVMVEAPGFNNTLAPYKTCKNAYRPDLTEAQKKLTEWLNVYIPPIQQRLNRHMKGYQLSVRDVYDLQLMCAYETVALGGSKFCELFSDDEFGSFSYASDLVFWYMFAFGQPAQAAIGLGWVQEWLARITKTPLTTFNSTTNATLHDSTHFPLDQPLYVDATHDTVISAVLTTLRLESFARGGPLPSTHVPRNRTFDITKISPFAGRLESQIMQCDDQHRYVRWLLNDGTVPLNVVKGCEDSTDGLCRLDRFVSSTIKTASEIDWAHDCLGSYALGKHPILDGRPRQA